MTPENSDLSIDGSRLVVKKDLGFGQNLALEGALSGLVSSPDAEVILDLSGVVHLCSSNLAVLASACNTLAHRGKKVRILAESSVARVLRLGGIERLADIKDVSKS